MNDAKISILQALTKTIDTYETEMAGNSPKEIVIGREQFDLLLTECKKKTHPDVFLPKDPNTDGIFVRGVLIGWQV